MLSQQSTSAKQTPAERFPIRILSERTGVGTSTLRAWERRYGLLTPERTPKGHRLYSEQDVQLVDRILTLLEEGHSLSAIAKQVKVDPGFAPGETDVWVQTDVWSDYRAGTLQAIQDFSNERIEVIFNEVSSLYPVDLVTERLIEPVLVALGENWQLRETGIAQEHFYASWVRNRLGARFHHAINQATGVRILCACVPRSYHEIGLMLFSISALTRGYRVLYFGTDLPLGQIPPVVRRSGVHGVVLASREDIDESMDAQLTALLSAVDIPLLLGGPASDQAIPAFEAAGGVRLGSRIAIALRVLGSYVPVYGNGDAHRHRKIPSRG